MGREEMRSEMPAGYTSLAPRRLSRVKPCHLMTADRLDTDQRGAAVNERKAGRGAKIATFFVVSSRGGGPKTPGPIEESREKIGEAKPLSILFSKVSGLDLATRRQETRVRGVFLWAYGEIPGNFGSIPGYLSPEGAGPRAFGELPVRSHHR